MGIFFLIAAVILVLLLYRRGLLVTKRITAVLFLFRPERGRDRASLNSCSGWVRHMGKFRESGSYIFSLDLQLSQGDAEVSLLDGKNRELLRLNRQLSTGTAALKQNGRYHLHWEFRRATGNVELRWENI